MNQRKLLFILPVLFFSTLFLSACTKNNLTNKDVGFSNEEDKVEDIEVYSDKLAKEPINITKTYKLNQEFPILFKTFNPEGQGTAIFKAKSKKELSEIDERLPEEGKKLIVVEIAVKGNRTNKGSPSTFNQIGDYPSPQFVIIDKANNISEVETTYYSDAYTVSKKMFELSKITLDGDQWVNTAIVFQIDKNKNPDLGFRFTNLEGKTEFYAIE